MTRARRGYDAAIVLKRIQMRASYIAYYIHDKELEDLDEYLNQILGILEDFHELVKYWPELKRRLPTLLRRRKSPLYCPKCMQYYLLNGGIKLNG